MINPNYFTSVTGRLTRNPDYGQTDNGTAVCRFCVAVDMGKGETEFVDCKAFRMTADFVERYFTQGKWISVVGSNKTEKYTGKDGQQKERKTLIVDNVAFCGARDEQPAVTKVRNEDGTLDITIDEEDLPF